MQALLSGPAKNIFGGEATGDEGVGPDGSLTLGLFAGDSDLGDIEVDQVCAVFMCACVRECVCDFVCAISAILRWITSVLCLCMCA